MQNLVHRDCSKCIHTRAHVRPPTHPPTHTHSHTLTHTHTQGHPHTRAFCAEYGGSLYDTCARLKALYVKHCNKTRPNPVMHYMSRSAPHSPCMRHTHVYVHTTTPQTSLHKPQAVYVRSRGRRHSRSGVAVTVGRESAEAAAGDVRWVHLDRKLDGWLLPGMDREIVSLDITKLRTTWRCVNQI